MPNKDLTHLAERLFNVPLYIVPDKLSVIMQVLQPRLAAGSLLLDPALANPDPELLRAVAAPATATQDRLAGLTARATDPSAEIHLPTIPAGNGKQIAVISAMGTLVHRSGYLGAMSGLTSYERLRAMFRVALNSGDIGGIMYLLDTNGGEGAGLFDLVDEIYQARGRKPIHAFINERAFSAGCALATACEVVSLPRTGGTGSVGVIAQHVDQSAWNKKQGLKVTPIFAGARKNDFTPHEPLTREAHAALQAMVDQGYELFTAITDRNRNLQSGAARKTEAALFWGEGAVKAGLADSIQTWDQAIEALATKVRSNRQGGNTMANTTLRQKLAALFKGHSGDELAAALEGTATDPNTATDPAGGEATAQGDQPSGQAQGQTGAPGDQAPAASQTPAGQTTAPPADQQPITTAGQAATTAPADPAAAAQQIVQLCTEAGHPELAGAVISHAGLDAEKAKTALAAATEIAGLCTVAGSPELKGQVIAAHGFDVEKSRAAITDHKAARGDANRINSGTTAGPGSGVNYLMQDAERRAKAATG